MKRTKQLLSTLKAMYPQFGANLGRDEVDILLATWDQSLEKISDESILKGIERLKDSGSSFPPSLPEFIKLCGGIPKPWGATWSGIVKKGAELGLTEEMFSHPQQFKQAVESRAQLQLGSNRTELLQ